MNDLLLRNRSLLTTRPLTVDRSFLQMSGMTIGSMIEADRRLRGHEAMMRNRKKIARDAEVWRRYEEDYLQRTMAESDSSSNVTK